MRTLPRLAQLRTGAEREAYWTDDSAEGVIRRLLDRYTPDAWPLCRWCREPLKLLTPEPDQHGEVVFVCDSIERFEDGRAVYKPDRYFGDGHTSTSRVKVPATALGDKDVLRLVELYRELEGGQAQ